MNLPNSIELYDLVEVYDVKTNELVGWGWFEFNEEDGLWFREDFHHKFPRGMNIDVIDNIFNKQFKFKKWYNNLEI